MIMLSQLTRTTMTLSRRFASQKAATGLVGLPVAEDGIGELKEISNKILENIQVSFLTMSVVLFNFFTFLHL